MEYISRVKNFKFKKSLGQNFLIERSVIEKILSRVEPCDNVIEIGAGAGFVTEELVRKAKSVRAIEIDKAVIPILKTNCLLANVDADFEIIEQSVLDVSFKELAPMGNAKVVANIPYNITSLILAHILGEIDDVQNENRDAIDEIILMVQWEVAKRLVADENSPNKEYGMLTILAQFWCDVEILQKVPRNAFYPSPKVDSALLRLKVRKEPKYKIPPLLRRTIKACFATRRKNIKNSLNAAGFLNVEKTLGQLGIDPNLRGEKLSIEGFCALAGALSMEQEGALCK
ncbi:ribosomal RNA small subunit methyltransferase A [Candidatus Gastranaerophilus sp. (ex Termes propinquus)]|nr:ribosomal RNA small subunit methyltransferase A [Candidatus Gastranaerophilus sp. (ex Termes propinquus)]